MAITAVLLDVFGIQLLLLREGSYAALGKHAIANKAVYPDFGSGILRDCNGSNVVLHLNHSRRHVLADHYCNGWITTRWRQPLAG